MGNATRFVEIDRADRRYAPASDRIDVDRERHVVGLEFLNAKDFFSSKGNSAISKRRLTHRAIRIERRYARTA